MKVEEIAQAAKEWADNFDSYDPTFTGIKRMTAEISYRKGAEVLNKRQPYSREDMIKMGKKCFNKGCAAGNSPEEDPDYNEILKLWEETK